MKPKPREGKHYLTLIELLLVLALLGIVGSAFLFPFHRWLGQIKQEQEVNRLLSKVFLCQEIVLDYNIDVALHLMEKEDGLHCEVLPMGVIVPTLKKLINRETTLQAFTSFEWNGGEMRDHSLFFFSSGALPKGKLTLVGKDKIDLYFSGFMSGTKKKFLQPFSHDQAETFPEEAALLSLN